VRAAEYWYNRDATTLFDVVADDPLASPTINPDSAAQLHFLAGRVL
jgi:hypothetical protein